MTRLDTKIRMRADGSINTDHYVQRARRLRSEAAHAMVGSTDDGARKRRGLSRLFYGPLV